MTEPPKLILKRSALADAEFEDYDVLSEGNLVGRIYKGQQGPSERAWFWGLAYGYHRDRNPAHATSRRARTPWPRSARAGCGNSGCKKFMTSPGTIPQTFC
jgi:hypothetical protein